MILIPPESRVQQRLRQQSADRRVEHLHGVCQTDNPTGTMDRCATCISQLDLRDRVQIAARLRERVGSRRRCVRAYGDGSTLIGHCAVASCHQRAAFARTVWRLHATSARSVCFMCHTLAVTQATKPPCAWNQLRSKICRIWGRTQNTRGPLPPRPLSVSLRWAGTS